MGLYQLEDYNDKEYEFNEKGYVEFYNDFKKTVNSKKTFSELLPYLNDNFKFSYHANKNSDIYIVIFPEDIIDKRKKDT